MGAEIIPFAPGARAARADRGAQPNSVSDLVGLAPVGADVVARYEEILPVAREFVAAWIDEPEAIADFLAWAHARGALKL